MFEEKLEILRGEYNAAVANGYLIRAKQIDRRMKSLELAEAEASKQKRAFAEMDQILTRATELGYTDEQLAEGVRVRIPLKEGNGHLEMTLTLGHLTQMAADEQVRAAYDLDHLEYFRMPEATEQERAAWTLEHLDD